MSRSQKRALIRFAVRLSILAVLLISIISQYITIHNLKEQNKALYGKVMSIEGKVNSYMEPTGTTDTETSKGFTYLGEWQITGYDARCEHCCGKSDGITASMTTATVGRTVAMNQADMEKLGIEYGDTIYIDGLGERVVEDTGCGSGVIDVACEDHSECYEITGTYNVFRKE